MKEKNDLTRISPSREGSESFKTKRLVVINEKALSLPKYVSRSPGGWQFRIRGVTSKHFADSSFGGAEGALKAAGEAAKNFRKDDKP